MGPIELNISKTDIVYGFLNSKSIIGIDMSYFFVGWLKYTNNLIFICWNPTSSSIVLWSAFRANIIRA